MAYHQGEIEVQSRAGVREQAARMGAALQPRIPDRARAFLSDQRFVVLSTIDLQGNVWASLRSGEPGFLQTPDDRTLLIHTANTEHLRENPAIGVLAIEFETRRRMRLNGTAEILGSGQGIRINTQQVYANCPKYIHPHEVILRDELDKAKGLRTAELSAEQQAWIEKADTFFIATYHPSAGADASHRGGPAGFVKAPDSQHLVFPDFPGNNMFNTLGNLSVYSSAGLLFVEFNTGATLQITGEAIVRWGEVRNVIVTIKEVVETRYAD